MNRFLCHLANDDEASAPTSGCVHRSARTGLPSPCATAPARRSEVVLEICARRVLELKLLGEGSHDGELHVPVHENDEEDQRAHHDMHAAQSVAEHGEEKPLQPLDKVLGARRETAGEMSRRDGNGAVRPTQGKAATKEARDEGFRHHIQHLSEGEGNGHHLEHLHHELEELNFVKAGHALRQLDGRIGQASDKGATWLPKEEGAYVQTAVDAHKRSEGKACQERCHGLYATDVIHVILELRGAQRGHLLSSLSDQEVLFDLKHPLFYVGFLALKTKSGEMRDLKFHARVHEHVHRIIATFFCFCAPCKTVARDSDSARRETPRLDNCLCTIDCEILRPEPVTPRRGPSASASAMPLTGSVHVLYNVSERSPHECIVIDPVSV